MGNPRKWVDEDGYALPVLAEPIEGNPIVSTGIVATPINGPTAIAAPIAEFSADDEVGEAPFTVTFSDESTGDPDAWHWDFGDGETSSEQNPEHEYTEVGVYTVTLYASKVHGGVDTEIKEDFIEVTEPA